MDAPNHPNQTVLGASGSFDDDDIIYVNLDSILDTRLGTLGKIDPKLAASVLDNGYRDRLIDRFTGVDDAVFKDAYAKRDLETLKMSVVTNVSFLLRRIIKDGLALAVQQQKITRLNIDLNVWPYEFSPGPMTDMLISCMRVHAYENAVVRIISIEPKHLTPEYAGKNYQMLIMYDWLEWFTLHKTFFEKKGIPSVAFIAPQLCLDKVPSKEEMIGLSSDGKDIFQITEAMCAPMFRLNMMPASLFSIIDELQKDNALAKVVRVQKTPHDLETIIKQRTSQTHVVHESMSSPSLSLDELSMDSEAVEDEYPLL